MLQVPLGAMVPQKPNLEQESLMEILAAAAEGWVIYQLDV
jgi:hypothetical protein